LTSALGEMRALIDTMEITELDVDAERAWATHYRPMRHLPVIRPRPAEAVLR
jgi:hypothetical protein